MDYFELFDEPRRPWVDGELLKQKFLERSAQTHPDRSHGASTADRDRAQNQFTDLNAAYQCLRETKGRLRHLLELESGQKPADVQQAPAQAMQLFFEVASQLRDVDRFLAERARTTSPLVRVQLFEKAQDWTEKITAIQDRVAAEKAHLEEELRALNSTWEAAPPVTSSLRVGRLPLAQLEALYRRASFLTRWSAQLRERITILSLPI